MPVCNATGGLWGAFREQGQSTVAHLCSSAAGCGPPVGGGLRGLCVPGAPGPSSGAGEPYTKAAGGSLWVRRPAASKSIPTSHQWYSVIYLVFLDKLFETQLEQVFLRFCLHPQFRGKMAILSLFPIFHAPRFCAMLDGHPMNQVNGGKSPKIRMTGPSSAKWPVCTCLPPDAQC